MPDRAGLKKACLGADAPADTARVFFALWPDDEVRQQLDQAAATLHRLRGGRRSRVETLHLTLVFNGTLPREQLPIVEACARAVKVPAFSVDFDRSHCWRHNRIAFLTASKPPEALPRLVAELERALQQAGIPFDRRPYKAHITLVRNADCGPEDPPMPPIRWSAREFLLLESRLGCEGASYVPLARFALG